MTHANESFAERLEQALGDPFQPEAAPSFDRIVELDEREEFPSEFLALLRRHGTHLYLIPKELGGSLESFEESARLLRSISRRDLTAAIAFGQTFLGSIPVWLAGSENQKQALAALVRDGQLGCLALTEEAHGGDLTACEFRAVPVDGHYRVSGKKWLINNGSHGGFATVFAKTGDQVALSAFSLLFLERNLLKQDAALVGLPKIRTHGIRGADISGFQCDNLQAPESAVIGVPGRGYEITLKTLQISRTMCAALSLGAGDTALRAALSFALERKVFGDTVANIPSARAQLTGAYVDLLICECLSTAVTRAIQVCPERLPVWSAVVKYLVPTLVEELIRESAIVLGARHYVREGRQAIFQKMMRDNQVVALFDGSTAVNLHIISGQLPALVAKRGTSPERVGRLSQLFDWHRDVPWRGFPGDSQLSFTNDGYDEIVDGLRALAPRDLPPQAAEVQAELQTVERAMASAGDAKDRRANSVKRFSLAKRYCLVAAAAACVMAWTHGSAEEEWLAAALQRILGRLQGEVKGDLPESLFERMVEQHRRNQPLSLRGLSAPTAAGQR